MSRISSSPSPARGATAPVPLSPTPERLARSVFTGSAPLRVLNTVQALLNAGDIGQDAANAAERWYRDWMFAREGVADYAPAAQAASVTRHDAVSWQLVRGRASARLADVRAALGGCGEVRLCLMMVREMSFAQMGKTLFPHLSEARARLKVSAQCAMVLEQLDSFYATARNRHGSEKSSFEKEF
ncbi:hypothetical protein OQ496_12620 [Acetobacter suratthaniensis]|uniref:hypothetical protein n=1 Tax=Acetobacter suratthaniensis TaxID=1502841 RepID=UPI001FAF3621|nr:hypothetical protein [Acetobacter suratthaniensis]MCX2567295.1 hypothetical protein [Acetobacter suratthaniensis]